MIISKCNLENSRMKKSKLDFFFEFVFFDMDKLHLSLYLCTASGIPKQSFGSVCPF